MAIDQALLERAGRRNERWLRLYRWVPHCLSFGRHERASARYDRRRIEAKGLDVVRRPTGGRAVWHAGELTYAVVVPAGEAPGLRAAYLEIHHMLLDAVRALGAAAELAPSVGAAGLDAGACFAQPVGGEIVAGGRKVVGSAQVREAGGLLQHGSILLDEDQSLVREMTVGAAPPDGSAPLSSILGRPVGPMAAAAAVAGAAAARWRGSWAEVTDAGEVLTGARAHLPRFTSPEWTWRA